MLFGRRFLFAAFALVGGAYLAPTPARADFTLTLHQEGYTDVTVNDLDSHGNPTGHILYTGSFGTFSFMFDFATSNSTTGQLPATLTLNTFSLSSNEGGTLKITVQDTGFMVPSGPAQVTTQLSTTSLTNLGSVSEQTLVNGVQIGDTLTLTAPNPAGASTTADTIISGSPYTLTNVTTVSLGAYGLLQSTGTSTVSTAPAPAGLVLAATAAPFAGLLRRRLKKAVPVA